jgi:microcystin-dependent protein
MLATPAAPAYGPAVDLVPLANAMLDPAGGGQPHENRQPYLALNFLIALQGIFPPRN